MSSRIVVEVFAEDKAHEAFLRPLIARVVKEEGGVAEVNVRSATGGHPRVKDEYTLFQRSLLKGLFPIPDLIVACIDANCLGHAQAAKEISVKTDSTLQERVLIACPDPHIERWFMADPESFAQVVGTAPQVRKGKCERNYYKKVLVDTIRQADLPAPLSGIEFAVDLVEVMDLFRAGKNDVSLKAFLEGFRQGIRRRISER